MASAAEQLASNLSWSAFSKAKDLKARIWFTLGALLIYRFSTYVPLPGINADQLAQVFNSGQQSILDVANVFSGGAIERLAIVALGIMPYITASIIMQLMTSMVPSLQALKKEGEAGRRTINQYTRYGTVLLGTVQAYGVAVGLESQGNLVTDPGLFFRATTVVTLLGGTMFLMWLGEQITARGIGNGISLIIFAGIVAGLPGAIVSTLQLGQQGALSTPLVLAILVLAIALIAIVVFFERALRKLLIQYPKRQVGNQQAQGESSHLPLKLNTAGVIPPIFAQSLLILPITLASFAAGNSELPGWITTITSQLGRGQPVYFILYGAMIAFFAFFYTALVLDPKDTANNLRNHGGFIPGIRPGERTAQHIDYVLTRVTVVGALYLVFVCLIPELLISSAGVPFYLGGTSLLIAVSVTMDTVNQIQSHLIAQQYEGLIKKSKLRGGKRRR